MSNRGLSYGEVGSLHDPTIHTKRQSFSTGFESRPVKGTYIGDLPPVVQEPTSTEAEKQAFILLPGLQEEIAKCNESLKFVRSELLRMNIVYQKIKNDIRNGVRVIKDGRLVFNPNKKQEGGQKSKKSKKSKKTKKRKYKRSKHRHTKNIVRT
jgi:hypothetical protein